MSILSDTIQVLETRLEIMKLLERTLDPAEHPAALIREVHALGVALTTISQSAPSPAE